MSSRDSDQRQAADAEGAAVPAKPQAGTAVGLADSQLDEVSAGLSLLEGGALQAVVPADELSSLGKLVQGKDLLAQLRPGGRGITPVDHQSRDMD